jgi:formate hydrogenlyase transcriptional activator
MNDTAIIAGAGTTIDRYEALLRASTAIAAYRDSQAVVERFAKELQHFLDFDYVLITVIDEATHQISTRLFQAFGAEENIVLPDFQPDETPSGWVYDHQKPIVVSDWLGEARYPRLRDYLMQFKIRSSCVLPLTTRHRRVGAFAVGVARPNAYCEDEVRFLSLVADHIALAVDSALNFEATQRAQAELVHKNEQLELVLDLTNRLVGNLELRELLREVSASVRRVMRSDAAGVALPDPEGTHLRFYALDFPEGKGFLTAETRIPIERSPLGIAYQTGQPQLRGRPDIATECPEACANPALREGLRSGCFLPLLSRGRVLGVLALSRFTEGGFTPEEIEFLCQVARQIAIAVENALAYGEIAELKERLAQEKLYLEDEIKGEMDFEGIVGQSSGLRTVLQLVDTVASSDSTVLLLGETGTGKELIARAIHERSRRKDRTFVKLNCAAIPTGLLESELFGHEKGAFTGAIAQKLGRLELADQGTLFLDEVGDIPPEIQPKQHQEGERPPGGGDEPRPGEDGRVTGVSQRPLLPAERVPHPDSAPARTARRYPAAGALLYPEVLPAHGEADRIDSGSGAGQTQRMALAREHPRTGEFHRAGGDPDARHHPAGPAQRTEERQFAGPDAGAFSELRARAASAGTQGD